MENEINDMEGISEDSESILERVRIRCKTHHLQKPTPSLQKMLDEHKLWLKTFGNEGKRLDVSGMDLQDTDFSGYDLSFMIARNTGFQRCNFTNASLLCADLELAKLYHCHVKNTIFVGANLKSINNRLTSFTGSIIRESDVRIFHPDLMGPQRSFWNTITIMTSIASIAAVYPIAQELLSGYDPIYATAITGLVAFVIGQRPAWEFVRGGWLYQPFKNLNEVVWNKKTEKIKNIVEAGAVYISQNKSLINESNTLIKAENIDVDEKIKKERRQQIKVNIDGKKKNISKEKGIVQKISEGLGFARK